MTTDQQKTCTHSITGQFSSRNVSATVFSPSLMAPTIYQENTAQQFTPISRQSSWATFIYFPDPKERFYQSTTVFSQLWHYDGLVWISSPAFRWHSSTTAANLLLGRFFVCLFFVVVCFVFWCGFFKVPFWLARGFFFPSTTVKGLSPSIEKLINE